MQEKLKNTTTVLRVCIQDCDFFLLFCLLSFPGIGTAGTVMEAAGPAKSYRNIL